MKDDTVKNYLLNKMSIIDKTGDEHWLFTPLSLAIDRIEELNKVKQELNKVSQELETYKKALELACDEIMWRECKNIYNYSFYCKTDCETYEACAKKIEWKDYFLKKAKEDLKNE